MTQAQIAIYAAKHYRAWGVYVKSLCPEAWRILKRMASGLPARSR